MIFNCPTITVGHFYDEKGQNAMHVIKSNDLNIPKPFSIVFCEKDGEISIDNAGTSLRVKDIFHEIQLKYPSRFRGAIVYSEIALRNNIRETRRIMSKYFGDKYNLVWAMKSAPIDRLVELAAQEGAGFDVGSHEELSLGLRYAEGRHIYHTSPAKFDWDLEAIVAHNCVSITDNLTELKELNERALRHNVVVDAGIRINPAVDTKTPKAISTGSLECKFGLPEIAGAFFDEVETFKNINVRILHMHIGSQIAAPENYALALQSMVKVYHEFLRRGFAIDTIDIGGGFPYSYQEEDAQEEHGVSDAAGHAFFNHIRHSFEEYISMIASTLKASLGESNIPTISIEPGRHIAAGTAIALGYILNSKMYPNGIQWLMSSISVNDLFFKLLAPETFFDVHVVTQNASDEMIPTAIGGTLCFSGDILSPVGKAVYLPKNISRNDIVMYGNVGAYAILGSGNFHNMRRLPIVMIDRESKIIELRGQEKPYFE